MVKLSSWFSIIRWALILTLLFIIIMAITPLLFPKYFDKDMLANDNYRIHCTITILLAIIGLFTICCYYFYLTLIFATLSILYLIGEIAMNMGNIGTYLTWIGVIICSYTYCAVMRRLRNDALYGP
ncbi:uncharacterized protein LOC124497104 [Dermatophagoides farinae]|uniref:Uncharacterized protein n=1 Tax=Dermatophagoides farinae TaxID=6954 RepID=A0A922HPQ3_DERFA|nr:uncharacterized protein LOC124497104 [Dermatophagoides farinae]KAH7637932.1 hypothetical protein HUG17_9036 [Dermatophagoides farinae]KAH9501430.1 hypothetical protein DERF_012278 [Dermatophagoides farinae]